MNWTLLLAKINQKAEKEHTHALEDVDGLVDIIEEKEVDSIIEEALKK